MAETRSTFGIAPRKVKAVQGYQVNSFADVQQLAMLGIAMDSASVSDMYHAAVKSGFAMDSALVGPQATTGAIGVPIQFLQAWLPGFVQTLTAARKIDELVGISTIGSWEDEEIVQGFSERTGFATPYSDRANFNTTGWNVNFAKRTIVRFEDGMEVSKLESDRAAKMNYNSAAEKRTGAAVSLEIQRNAIGFFGYNSMNVANYGFLNDPNLPAYVNVPAGASGSTEWAKKTTLEIIADILTALQKLRTQSGDRIDPKSTPITIAVGTETIDYLSTPTQFTFTVKTWLKDNYPNVRFESAPELDKANGGKNVAYVYAESFGDESTDDGKTFIQMVPTKFMTLGVQQMTKGYKEDYSNATAGVMCKRPYAVYRMSGV